MRIFVAGASGAVGRPLIRRLVAAGHQVTGMTRRESRADEVRAAGAEAAVCDVFDPPALSAAVAAAAPEVVVHELTSLPPDLDPTAKGALEANNRIRREGTRNLVAAAQGAGARRLVAQSIAFIYAPVGGWVKSEDRPGDEPGRRRARPARWRRPWSSNARCSRLRPSKGSCSATGSSTGRGPPMPSTATRPRRCAGAGSRSSAAATRSSPSSTSRTRPARRSPPVSAAPPGSTTCATPTPRPFASGSRPTPRRSGPSGRCGCRS